MRRLLSNARRLLHGFWRVFKQPTPGGSLRELFRITNEPETNSPLAEDDVTEERDVTDTPSVDGFRQNNDSN